MTIELSCAIGDYPHIKPLKSGAVASPLVKLDFAAITPINRAFAPMVRELKFDVSEMAIGTFIQAKAYGKMLALLPVVTLARFQESAMLCRADSTIRAPEDLKGRRVGVRAYSQTTGLWLRGTLADDYGIAPESIDWSHSKTRMSPNIAIPPSYVERPPAKPSSPCCVTGRSMRRSLARTRPTIRNSAAFFPSRRRRRRPSFLVTASRPSIT